MTNKPIALSEPALKTKLIQADTVDEAVGIITKNKRISNMQLNFGEENVEPGDNARYLRHALVSLDLPPIDISDPEQVKNRIYEYFQYCLDNDRKPNMKGIGNWLGVDSTTVNSWKRGEYRTDTHSPLIKKSVDILEEIWIDYMLNGKVNPASGIFIGKNLFGYKDVQDVVLNKENPLGPGSDETTIRKQIEALPVVEIEDGE